MGEQPRVLSYCPGRANLPDTADILVSAYRSFRYRYHTTVMNTGINSSSNAAGSGIGGIATVAQRIRDRAHQLESTRFELSQLQRTVTRQGRIMAY